MEENKELTIYVFYEFQYSPPFQFILWKNGYKRFIDKYTTKVLLLQQHLTPKMVSTSMGSRPLHWPADPKFTISIFNNAQSRTPPLSRQVGHVLPDRTIQIESKRRSVYFIFIKIKLFEILSLNLFKLKYIFMGLEHICLTEMGKDKLFFQR